VDPAWTATQIGHASSRFTIDVYTDVHDRRQSAAERIGSLIRGGDSGASTNSNASETALMQATEAVNSAL
jgi:hypothetical protein